MPLPQAPSRHLNQGDYQSVALQFAQWDLAGGQVIPALQARRAQEAEPFEMLDEFVVFLALRAIALYLMVKARIFKHWTRAANDNKDLRTSPNASAGDSVEWSGRSSIGDKL